jgi:hypothetical protein
MMMKKLLIGAALALSACQPVPHTDASVATSITSAGAPAPGAPPPIAAPIQRQMSSAVAEAPTVYASCEKALFDPHYGVFAHEGGYQNSPEDGGNWSTGHVGKGVMCGGTKYGLPCAFFPKLDIRNLTKPEAAKVYERNQCAELKIGDFKGQRVPTMFVDLAVNMGTGTAIKFIIKTLDGLEGKPFDPKTKLIITADVIRRYNAYTVDFHKRREFLFALSLVAIDHYCDIVQSNPKQAVWLLGWIVRVNPLND